MSVESISGLTEGRFANTRALPSRLPQREPALFHWFCLFPAKSGTHELGVGMQNAPASCLPNAQETGASSISSPEKAESSVQSAWPAGLLPGCCPSPESPVRSTAISHHSCPAKVFHSPSAGETSAAQGLAPWCILSISGCTGHAPLPRMS